MNFLKISPTQDPSIEYEIPYEEELFQDLKPIYGLDPEQELLNILQAEADAKYEKEYNHE